MAFMISTKLFHINTPQVVYEVFEDEVIIVNLDSGHYYSTVNVGMAIWLDIVAGCSLAEMLRKLKQVYNADAQTLESSVHQFLEHLQREAIITVQSVAQNEDEETVALDQSTPQAEGQPFEQPTLNLYDDMQDLLVLDPIHEVDDSGWPNVPLNTNS